MIDREERGSDETARADASRRAGIRFLVFVFGVPLALVLLAEIFLF